MSIHHHMPTSSMPFGIGWSACVRTQNWHIADQTEATGQTGVPGWSDRSGPIADPATATLV
jgi:hypothetical protein